ncbi:Crp/Fnr family transcriptional regulator [Chryseobacterium sp. PTM-20240506]|uniref:Crp/Fnr family transcriptional regulator n=1 Tax=unclassified Chryseobacterium TaxID=2593645 RepID=UPI00235A3571|nr:MULTISPECIES: Crp/Fnr family transcriptional regulator [unclassified Chryseobacterium]MDC8103387.1 Crp/Fnr family transcriptional regulator [Chryseobacterium sp. B21-037]MDQ1802943.1 Crp/Fnr family transcriptional regulator [Chryseobacterium sp. CKR4-1]
MHETLFKYIEDKSGMTLKSDEKILIEEKFKPKKFRKRQYLLQEGDVCKYASFVVKGSARMFSVNDKGQEHIVRFGVEDWWLGDPESYTQGTPTKFHIEMLEDSELLQITWEHLQDLMAAIPAVAATLKSMDKQSFIASQKRIHAAISMSAEERYEELMKSYPSFILRFPQNMVASYLGISPETLSRIKKNALNG